MQRPKKKKDCAFDTLLLSFWTQLWAMCSSRWTGQLMRGSQTVLPCKARTIWKATQENHTVSHFCLMSLVLPSYFRHLQHRDQVSHMETYSVTVKNGYSHSCLISTLKTRRDIVYLCTPTLSICHLLPGAMCFSWNRGYRGYQLTLTFTPTLLLNLHNITKYSRGVYGPFEGPFDLKKARLNAPPWFRFMLSYRNIRTNSFTVMYISFPVYGSTCNLLVVLKLCKNCSLTF